MGVALVFTIAGVGVWLLAYFNHDRGSGIVRVPERLHRLVRRDQGPVRVSSIAAEILAGILVACGLAIAARLVEPGSVLSVVMGGTVTVLVIDVVLTNREHRRERRKSD
jgi:hypothetical protein